MADTDRSFDEEGKKLGGKLSLGRGKLPIDAILLVVVPFVSFMLLFMYAMGLIPPRPPHVQVIGAQQVEQGEAVGTEPGEGLEPPLSEPTATEEEPEDDQSSFAADDTTEAVEVAADEGVETEVVSPEDIGDFISADTTMTGEERIKRIKQLAKVYEQMNASSVAAIVTSMEDGDAVGILSNMKPRSAAKVLASLEPERAAVLSLMLTR